MSLYEWFVILSGVGFLAVRFIVSIASVNKKTKEEKQFDKWVEQGHFVTAREVKKTRHNEIRDENYNVTTEEYWRVEYEYFVDGIRYTAKTNYSGSENFSSRPTIYYDPKNPKKCYIGGKPNFTADKAGRGCGLSILIAVVYMIVMLQIVGKLILKIV